MEEIDLNAWDSYSVKSGAFSLFYDLISIRNQLTIDQNDRYEKDTDCMSQWRKKDLRSAKCG